MNKLKSVVLLAVAAGCAVTAWAATPQKKECCGEKCTTPKVIAHRGYWDTKGSAQNSIRSLVKADSIGCYASEFDVWMTADGVMVVNHDPTINGVEIQKSPAEVVLKQKLSNGEYIPTLEKYLETAKGLKTRLVLELKSHDSREQEKAAAQKAVDMVKKYGLDNRTDYIAFSPYAFKDFIKIAPKTASVYYLNGDFVPAQIKHMKGRGIDYAIKVMRKHPEWIKECHDKGMEVNVWTVTEADDIQWCIDNGVDYITTNDPELTQKMVKK